MVNSDGNWNPARLIPTSGIKGAIHAGCASNLQSAVTIRLSHASSQAHTGSPGSPNIYEEFPCLTRCAPHWMTAMES